MKNLKQDLHNGLILWLGIEKRKAIKDLRGKYNYTII